MADQYEDLANELAAAAEAIRSLAGQNLPNLSYVKFDIQPAQGLDNDTIISAVDTIGQALLGQPGETKQMSNGNYHHGVGGQRGRLLVQVYQRVDPPEQQAMEAKLARLRAEAAALRGEGGERRG